MHEHCPTPSPSRLPVAHARDATGVGRAIHSGEKVLKTTNGASGTADGSLEDVQAEQEATSGEGGFGGAGGEKWAVTWITTGMGRSIDI